MAKWIRRLFFKDDGSVSVYLIVILLPMFLFHAVLIDLVRYELAERQTERAVKAAARSILSEYAEPLREYGLFGRYDDASEMNQLFAEILAKNFISPDQKQDFTYLDIAYQPESSSVKPVYSLANQQVFRDQVNEDMKYQAPIEFALSILEKFRKPGATEGMNSAETLYEQSDDLDKRWGELNDQLDRCWKLARELSQKAKDLSTDYSSRLENLKTLADKTGITTASEIEQSIADIDQSLTDTHHSISTLSDSLQMSQVSLTELMKHAKKNAEQIKLLNTSIQSMREQLSSLNSRLSELAKKKEDAQQLLKDLADYLAKVAVSQAAIVRDQGELTKLGQELNKQIGAAQIMNTALRKEKERLIAEAGGKSPATELYQAVPVLSDDALTQYQIDSGKAVASFSAFAIHWKETTLFTGDRYKELKEGAGEVMRLADQFIAKQEPIETTRMAKRKEQTNRQEEQQTKLDKLLHGQTAITGTCIDANQAAFDRLGGSADNRDAGLYAKYMKQNGQKSAADGSGGLQSTEEPTGKTNIQKALTFGDRIQKLLVDARGELYLNEYAMQRTFSPPDSTLALFTASSPENSMRPR
jgi:septal ring factor EnvC (AmiA/AmiB activator)